MAQAAEDGAGGNGRLLADRLCGLLMGGVTLFCGAIVLMMALALLMKSMPILREHSIFEIISSPVWKPLKGKFGLFAFVMGTVWVTGVAMLLATPLSILSALYLSEYSPRWVRSVAVPLMDILAGIPSVVYGIWGVLALVPFSRWLASAFGVSSTGYCVLAGGIVLAVMVCPVMTQISLEVLKCVPLDLRDVSLSLGSTKWQAVKLVVLRKAAPGIVAAGALGLSRALGETMAVLMVAGNVAKTPFSLFSPAYPLPALIANNYGESLSIPLYDSALLLSALVLMLVVLAFNAIGRLVLLKISEASA